MPIVSKKRRTFGQINNYITFYGKIKRRKFSECNIPPATQ